MRFALCALCITAGSAMGMDPAVVLFDQDLLESPPTGDIRVNLSLFATGLIGNVDETPQYMPTDMVQIPDGSGRMCVLTLGGVIRLIHADGSLDSVPYLITTNEDSYIDPANFGAISIAFHPDFADPKADGYGRFYVIETENDTAGVPDFDGSLLQVSIGGVHHDVLYEYTATDPSSNTFAGTRRSLMRVEQPGKDHNLFDICFDDDGLMFVSSGDGGNQGEGVNLIRQNAGFLGNVFGKILRIDPLGSNSDNGQYGIPEDNPFVSTDGALGEIYSYGHRSPYRLTIDDSTGDLWLGEVGQQQVEEVNKIVAGGNYGWSTKEGSFIFDQTDFDNNSIDSDSDKNGTGDAADADNLIDPVFEVDHQTARSITGGFIYQPDDIPGLEGMYIFSDAFGNGLFYGDPAEGSVAGETGGVQRFRFDPSGVSMPFGTISIAQDFAGSQYLLAFDGRILQINPWACSIADFVPDGVLNFLDVSAFLGAYGNQDPDADINGDTTWNFLDVSQFLGLYGKGCP